MTKDMTTGPITPLLVNFTIPLVLGNLFQLTYNAVDSIIVGKFVGEDALAAVGTSNPLMTLAILFINGVCLGAGILVSLAFGAGNTELVERQVSTTAIAGSVFSLVFSLTCVILANPLLRLLQVPEEILPIAVNYLRIVFGGLLFTFFYNFLAATMRALGDSKSALYFLMISSVLNIGGDLFFVKVLDWGSEGCALSTVLSEALCCVFCLIYIRWKVPVLQLGRRWFIFDSSLLKKTISYGWTSAMQQATVQLGKIAIQAIVNTMGVNAMAAFAAAGRIDDFAYVPQQNIGHATTTLMAQNRGASKKERVRASFFCGLKLEFLYAIFITAVCFFFAEPIIRLFVTDAAVVHLGVRFLKLVSLFYLMPSLTNGIQGGFRGLGDLKITLNSSTLNMAGRVAAAAVFVLLMKMDIEALPYSYVVGWVLMLVYEAPMMVKYLRKGEPDTAPGRPVLSLCPLDLPVQPVQCIRDAAQLIDELLLYGLFAVQHGAHVHHQLTGAEHQLRVARCRNAAVARHKAGDALLHLLEPPHGLGHAQNHTGVADRVHRHGRRGHDKAAPGADCQRDADGVAPAQHDRGTGL